MIPSKFDIPLLNKPAGGDQLFTMSLWNAELVRAHKAHLIFAGMSRVWSLRESVGVIK